MKSFAAILAIALVVFPGSAFASCPDISGLQGCCGGSWYTYSYTLSCGATSGSVSTSTDSCGDSVYAITGASGAISYSHTVQSTDPIINSAHWQVAIYVQFNGNNSASNTINVTVSVLHNGSTTNYTVLSQDGTQGTLDCGPQRGFWYFPAVVGDTITVTISGSNNGSATVKATAPTLFNSN